MLHIAWIYMNREILTKYKILKITFIVKMMMMTMILILTLLETLVIASLLVSNKIKTYHGFVTTYHWWRIS